MKKIILLILALSLLDGCVTIVPTSQYEKDQARIAKLEKTSELLATMTAMRKAGEAGAAFYPFSGDNYNEGTGDIDAIGSTADKDTAVGIFSMSSTYGNMFTAYGLDADGGTVGDDNDDSVPYRAEANDGGQEVWNMLNAMFYGYVFWGGANTLLDDTCVGIKIMGFAAGEDVNQFQPVYFNSTDGEWYEADADVSGRWPADGIAIDCIGGGNWPCQNGESMTVLYQGRCRNDSWSFTASSSPVRLYLSTTPTGDAGITTTSPSGSGECVQDIGRIESDDEVFLDFSKSYIELQ